GTSQIEIMYLDIPLYEVVNWRGDEFKKMENLKTLISKNSLFSKGPEHLPNSLRVLEWPRYPSQHIPSDFFPRKLSICKLPESNLTSFELHSSLKVDVREFDRVKFKQESMFETNTQRCSKLKSFPPMKLTSLEQLELSFCESLELFPEILGQMKNIERIVLKGTSIEEFPLSFQNLTGLHTLRIWGSGMLRLPELWLIKCNLPDELLPTLLMWFANELHVARSTEFSMAGTARRVPEWFEHLIKGPSISFWFRNKIPSIALLVVSKSMDDKSLKNQHLLRVIMFVNGDQYFLDERNGVYHIIEHDHTYLYDLHLQDREMKKSILKNEWNYVEVTYENMTMIPILTESGFHILKHEGSMEDVQFTNPFF
ncbi:disease resistance protein (TIR-NBS-LRR class), partial [Trifolium pratense]